jgi:hypothetical protein
MSNVTEISGRETEMRAVRYPVMGAGIAALFGNLLQRIDWVVVVIVVIPISVAAVDPVQLGPLLLRTRDAVEKTAPFMLMAIAIAGAVRAAGAENLIARAARQREGRMVALFAIAGAALPFCSCGVVPVIASLLAAGVPVAPVMAFWMSAPLMDPHQFFITAGELGWQLQSRAAAAVGLGLWRLRTWHMHSIGFASPIRFKIKITGPNNARQRRTVHWRFWNDRERLRVLRSIARDVLVPVPLALLAFPLLQNL